MKRAFISIILLISILLTFSYNAAALPTSDDVLAKAGLLKELGIINEIPENEELNAQVTRRDYVIAVAKMLGINTYEVNPNRYYRDIAEDDLVWNAAGALLERNVLTMNESQTFRPNDIITRDEASCISIKTLGISGPEYSEILLIARRSGVLDGVTNSRLTLRDMITILHNTLNAYMYDYVNVSKENYTIGQGSDTLLETYFDMFHIEGIVTSVNDTSITNETGYGMNTICIEDEILNTDIVDMYDYLGNYVSAYYEEGSKGLELKFISKRENKNKTVTFDIDDFLEFDSMAYTVEYAVGSAIKTLSVDKGVNVIKNGERISRDISTVFDGMINGEIKFVNSDNNNSYEIMVVDSYENIVVRYMDTQNRIIYGEDGRVVELGDESKACIITNAGGEERQLSDIASGNTVSIYKSDKLDRLVISNTTVTGPITSMSKRNGKRTVVIGGNEYVVDVVFSNANPDYFTVRMNVTAYIDASGKAAYFVTEKASGGIYAWVVAIDDELQGLEDDVKFKLFTENNEMTELVLSKNVRIDGKKCDTAEKILTAMSQENGKADGQIIIFDVNSDNEIKSIDTTAEGEENNGLFISATEAENYFYAGQLLIGPMIQMTSSSKVFVVPASAEYKHDINAYMALKGNAFFKDWEKYKVTGYRTGDKDKVDYTEAILLKTDLLGTSGFPTKNMNVFIIADVSQVYDEETGEIREQIDLISGKSEVSFLAADNYSFQGNPVVKVGNVVKITTNLKGNITNIELLYGEQTDGIKVTDSDNSIALKEWGTKDMYTIGYISSINNGLVGISMEIDEEPFIILPISNKPVAVYDPTAKDSVFSGGENDLIDAMNKGYKVVVDISRGNTRTYSVVKVNFENE